MSVFLRTGYVVACCGGSSTLPPWCQNGRFSGILLLVLRWDMADLTDQDVAAFADRLRAMKAELEDVQASSKDASAVVQLDQQSVGRLSRMDALQAQAMAQETDRRRALDLRKIAAALDRISEGEFGYCAVCGEVIDRGRLDLDPAAATCIVHAK